MFENSAMLFQWFFPWLVILAFWLFVIWAVLALIGVLKDIRTELRAIREQLGRDAGP
ncbi:MAG: hypothetical protein WD960_09045 [Gemmatimonadota bacterium]